MSEKYSISSWFYLFCFLLILGFQPVWSQEALWSHPGNGPRPHIVVVDGGDSSGLVLVSSPHSSKVLALQPKDGQKAWLTQLGGTLPRGLKLVADFGLAATHDATLYALESKTGEILWRQGPARVGQVLGTQPQFLDGKIFTATQRGLINQYSLTGQLKKWILFDFREKSKRMKQVALDSLGGRMALLSQTGRFREWNKDSLALVHESEGSEGDSETLGGAVSDSTLWRTTLGKRLKASDPKNGTPLWSVRFSMPTADIWSAEDRLLFKPILSRPRAKKLLIASRNEAQLFDARSGERLKALALPSPAVCPPIPDDAGRWLIVCEEHLVGVNIEGATKSWPLPLAEKPFAAAHQGELLLLADSKGRIYALSLANL